MSRHLILAACLCACALPAAGAGSVSDDDLKSAATLRDAALKDDLAYQLVASLTTEVGPRLAGSAGDRAAVAWAQRALAAIGLGQVRTQEVIVPHWERGGIEARITEPFPQPLAAVALGGSVGTAEAGIEAEIVAFDRVETLATAARDTVEGRIVYLGAHTDRERDGSGYGRTVRNRTAGASVAASLGAVAIAIRSVGTSDDRLAHTGTVSYTADAPRIPAVAVSDPDADLIERMLAGGGTVRLALKLATRDLPQASSANVIAEIPGSELPGEVVLLGAHLDSWDLGTGAIDDAAGVAIVGAAASLIARSGLKPRRTVRVVLFANEEFGLSGGRVYAESLGENLAAHVVMMEADFGTGRVFRLQSRVAEDALAVVDRIHGALEPLGIERGGNEGHGGSDLSPLRELGVPVLSLDQDGTRYFDLHHSANDTLDKIDPEALRQAVAAFATTAFLAAQANW